MNAELCHQHTRCLFAQYFPIVNQILTLCHSCEGRNPLPVMSLDARLRGHDTKSRNLVYRVPTQVLDNCSMKFWITLIRGLFALLLVVALVIQPDKTRPILGNFIGMYWLVSGIVSLRFTASGEPTRSRLAMGVGVIGILAGLAVLSRRLTLTWAPDHIVLSLLGVVVLLTGLLHTFVGFRERGGTDRHRTWTSVLLGIFEIVLGLQLIVAPLEQGPIFYIAGAIWALVGGDILIGDALKARRVP